MPRMGSDEELARRINLLTHRTIGLAFNVGPTLGEGFLEKVYENALCHELRKAGLKFEQQKKLVVWYDGVVVGDYTADVLVEDLVVLELKAGKGVDPAHEAQCINYLAATRFPICLLLNFSKRVEVRRVVGRCAPKFPGMESKPADMTWGEWADLDSGAATDAGNIPS